MSVERKRDFDPNRRFHQDGFVNALCLNMRDEGATDAEIEQAIPFFVRQTSWGKEEAVRKSLTPWHELGPYTPAPIETEEDKTRRKMRLPRRRPKQ